MKPRFPTRAPYIFFRFTGGYTIYMRPGKRSREARDHFQSIVSAVAAKCDDFLRAGVPANRVTAADIREARTATHTLVRYRQDAFVEVAIAGFPEEVMTEVSRCAGELLGRST